MSVVRYFHGSAHHLDEGSLLRSAAGGYVSSAGADDPLEALMERLRPPVAIPRSEAVFLCCDPDDIDNAGGYVDFVYAVAPEGVVTRHDLAWYSAAQIAIGNGDDASAESCARAYWAGRRHDDPSASVFEYSARSARVVGLVSGPPSP